MGLYLPTVADGYVTNDSHASAATAWRIATTGTPWMDEVETGDLEGSPLHETWLVDGASGHTVYNRTPGTILPAIPFYIVMNNDSSPDTFKIWVGGVSASVVTSLAGVVLFLALRLQFREAEAFTAAGAFLVASPAWSVSANALWTHNLTLLALAGAMYFSSQGRWWLTGGALAIGILARPHLAVIAVVLGLYLAWKRRDWRIIPAIGTSSACGLVALMTWNKFVFGSWSVRGGYAAYVTDNLTAFPANNLFYEFANHIGFFFAPDRGLFVWTPVALLLLPSTMARWSSMPVWVRGFALAGLVYSLVQLRINAFPGGQGFYGYRLALELLVCLTPALVHAFNATARWTRILIGALLGLQFAAFAIGAADERYYLAVSGLWTGNAYLTALQVHPVGFGGLSAVLLVAGGVAMHWTQRRMPSISSLDGGMANTSRTTASDAPVPID